jgi:hypothetical protein
LCLLRALIQSSTFTRSYWPRAAPASSSPVMIVVPKILLAAADRAVRGEVQVLADAAIVSKASVEMATQVVPRTFFYFARIDALAAFDDALAAFIDDSDARPRREARAGCGRG